MMLNDEGQVMSGLLMGLNAMDYNMTLPGEEFDRSVSGGGGLRGGRKGLWGSDVFLSVRLVCWTCLSS